MAIKFATPTGPRRALAERLFATIYGARQLRSGSYSPPDRLRVPLSRLFDYATDVARDDDPEIAASLKSDPFLAQDLKRLLQQTAMRQLPRVAAASTALVPTREGAGCRIRLMPSKADPSQVYVVIEILDSGAAPPALFVCDAEDRCQRFPLPPAKDGVVQMLVAADSELVKALSDVKTEVFMR